MSEPPDFVDYAAGLARTVDAWLEAELRLPADCPPRLRDAMSYSLLAGGKRLRPMLVILACEACGGSRESARPVACAIEMVHTYSLVHDDLPAMDDDDLRRGRPTCHKQFNEATAILAGDALLTLAFEVITRNVHPGDVAAACCRDLANAAGAVGMVGGQMADLEAERESPQGDTAAQLKALEAIHRRKTGRLLTSALTLGGRVSQASSESLAQLESYGANVGLAFQIADDLLDVEGNREKMGKNVHKDAGLGKLTYPGLLGVDESRRRAAGLVQQAQAALAPYGARGRMLHQLADYVLHRDR